MPSDTTVTFGSFAVSSYSNVSSSKVILNIASPLDFTVNLPFSFVITYFSVTSSPPTFLITTDTISFVEEPICICSPEAVTVAVSPKTSSPEDTINSLLVSGVPS